MRVVGVSLLGVLVACAGSDGDPGEMGDMGDPGDMGDMGNPGPEGPEGPEGPQGPAGAGLPCWDLDVSGSCDLGTEDTNTDGVCDVLDCRGAAGPVGPAGADGVDGAPGADGADGAVGPAGADGADGAVGPPGAPGAPGADGADGADGAAGPPGADGADGADGLPGADGADGAPGAPGADGADGADGAQGPSGVTTMSMFEGDWTQDLTGGVPIAPAVCQTALYTAGPNEVATVTVHVSANFGVDDFLFAAIVADVDGGGPAFAQGQFQFTGTSNGVGHVSNSAQIALVDGSTYLFGVGFQSQSDVTVPVGVCNGTVTVAAQ